MAENIDEVLEKVFKAVDADGSGTVCKRELKTMVGALADEMNLSESAVDDIQKGLMDMGDTDGDGTLDIEEFKSLFKSLLKQ